jgi:hypothetical protein
MDEFIDKLSEIFADSAVKTVGDLVALKNLENLEKLPKLVRDQTILPDVETSSVFPKSAYDAMRKAGIQTAAIDALVGEVVEFKVEMIEKAHDALSLD